MSMDFSVLLDAFKNLDPQLKIDEDIDREEYLNSWVKRIILKSWGGIDEKMIFAKNIDFGQELPRPY